MPPLLPGEHPHVVAAARRVLSDPDAVSERLVAACSGATEVPGELIAAAWVFDPDHTSTGFGLSPTLSVLDTEPTVLAARATTDSVD